MRGVFPFPREHSPDPAARRTSEHATASGLSCSCTVVWHTNTAACPSTHNDVIINRPPASAVSSNTSSHRVRYSPRATSRSEDSTSTSDSVPNPINTACQLTDKTDKPGKPGLITRSAVFSQGLAGLSPLHNQHKNTSQDQRRKGLLRLNVFSESRPFTRSRETAHGLLAWVSWSSRPHDCLAIGSAFL